MGQGPNYVLNKGFVAGGSSAYALGQVVTLDGDQTVNLAVTANDSPIIGLVTEDVDAAKVTTGKVVIGVAILGIAKGLAGASVSRGDRLVNEVTTARVIKQVGTDNTAVPVLGIALEDASDGDLFDVLLTPGGTYTIVGA